jgi:hypothetical protein
VVAGLKLSTWIWLAGPTAHYKVGKLVQHLLSDLYILRTSRDPLEKRLYHVILNEALFMQGTPGSRLMCDERGEFLVKELKRLLRASNVESWPRLSALLDTVNEIERGLCRALRISEDSSDEKHNIMDLLAPVREAWMRELTAWFYGPRLDGEAEAEALTRGMHNQILVGQSDPRSFELAKFGAMRGHPAALIVVRAHVFVRGDLMELLVQAIDRLAESHQRLRFLRGGHTRLVAQPHQLADLGPELDARAGARGAGVLVHGRPHGQPLVPLLDLILRRLHSGVQVTKDQGLAFLPAPRGRGLEAEVPLRDRLPEIDGLTAGARPGDLLVGPVLPREGHERPLLPLRGQVLGLERP